MFSTKLQKSKAVLFGINYNTSADAKLRGCINDVKNIASLLKTKMNFGEIYTYTDEVSNEPVTKANIINVLTQLARECREEQISTVWIHFSGHGSQVRDWSNDEEDGLDECFIASDYKRGGIITDDEFNMYFRLFPTTTKIICVFDCCHSGTMLDLKYSYQCNDNMNVYQTVDMSSISQRDGSYDVVENNIIMLSGCEDDQTSADAFNVMNKRTFTGALSSCLIETLNAVHFDISLYELVENLHRMLRKKNFTQKPMLSSTHVIKKTDKFLPSFAREADPRYYTLQCSSIQTRDGDAVADTEDNERVSSVDEHSA